MSETSTEVSAVHTDSSVRGLIAATRTGVVETCKSCTINVSNLNASINCSIRKTILGRAWSSIVVYRITITYCYLTFPICIIWLELCSINLVSKLIMIII